MGMTKDTPPRVRPEASLATYSQTTDLVQRMRIQLTVTGSESARMANLRPTMFTNIPNGGPPNAAPSANKDPTHEASWSVILKGLSWCCSIGVAGDVHDRRVPAETTIILAATHNRTGWMSEPNFIWKDIVRNPSQPVTPLAELNLPKVHGTKRYRFEIVSRRCSPDHRVFRGYFLLPFSVPPDEYRVSTPIRLRPILFKSFAINQSSATLSFDAV